MTIELTPEVAELVAKCCRRYEAHGYGKDIVNWALRGFLENVLADRSFGMNIVEGIDFKTETEARRSATVALFHATNGGTHVQLGEEKSWQSVVVDFKGGQIVVDALDIPWENTPPPSL